MKLTHILPKDKPNDWKLIVSHHLQTAFKWDKDLQLTIEPVKDSGNWSMTSLWYSWMNSTAEFMANNGVTMPLFIKPDGTPVGERRFNKDDAHEAFTSVWLGVNEKGERLSWSKSGENIADKGQRFNAMQKHEQYMTERGIKHMMPRESEYFIEREKAND